MLAETRCAVSLRQWLQSLLSGSQRKPSHEEPSNSTRPRTLNAPATLHGMNLIKNPPALTPREAEIVRLLRRGYSNKEIANELGIAVTTVKWNMTHILSKFEVQSSRQLIALLASLDENNSRDWTILG
jgi:DNA-binding CsgD family transcriptional regulator